MKKVFILLLLIIFFFVIHTSSAHAQTMLPHFFVSHHGSSRGDWIPDYAAVATRVISKSGMWSDVVGTTSAGDIILIESGVNVSYNLQTNVPFQALAIRGGLDFLSNQNTQLTVGTILVYPTGTFRIQTTNPAIKTEIVFSGQLNVAADPGQLTIGLVGTGGVVDIQGADVTAPYLTLAKGAKAGEQTLVVNGTPNWKVGDELYLPDSQVEVSPTMKGFAHQGEKVTVASIQGSTITLTTPLKYTHAPWALYSSHHKIYAAHLTRNVVFRSGGGTPGHILFGGMTRATVKNAMMVDLGRTTWDIVDDTRRDGTGAVVHVGTNQRGRYPLHAHHTGEAFLFEKNVIVNDPQKYPNKWGITIHNTFGVTRENIVVGIGGAGIAGEDGPETGLLEKNLVIGLGGGSGDGDVTQARTNVLGGADYGHGGYGYWFRGPLLDIKDNKAVGFFKLKAYSFWVDSIQPTFPMPDIYGMLPQYKGKVLNVQKMPLHNFEDNSADVIAPGLLIYNLNSDSLIKNFTLYERSLKGGVLGTNYVGRVTLENVQMFGSKVGQATSVGHGPGFDIFGGRIENFDIGLVADVNSSWRSGTVQGIHLNNKENILLTRGNRFTIEDVTYGVGQVNVKFDMSGELKDADRPKGRGAITDEEYIARLLRLHTNLNPVIVRNYNGVPGDDFMVAPEELVADYLIPRLGITNQELWDKYGRQSPNEVVLSGIKVGVVGRVGPIQSLGKLMYLGKNAPVYSTSLDYIFNYAVNEDGTTIATVQKQKAQLQGGLNTITRTVQGVSYNIYVYMDLNPPPPPPPPPPGTNQPPVLTLIGQQRVLEGTLLVISLDATDPDGDALTFTVSGLPRGAVLSSPNRTFTWTPDFDQSGPYSTVFKAHDGHGLFDTEIVNIVVVDVPSSGGGAGQILSITSPKEGETVSGSAISVTYTPAGNKAIADHVHLKLDNQPEVRDMDFDGSYMFQGVASGNHTLYAFLAQANHTKIPGSDVYRHFTSQGGAMGTPPTISPQILLTKSVDKKTALQGEIITYTLSYTNVSIVDGQNIIIADVIPQGATYIQGSATGSPTFDGIKLTWNISKVKSSESGTVLFQVRVD